VRERRHPPLKTIHPPLIRGRRCARVLKSSVDEFGNSLRHGQTSASFFCGRSQQSHPEGFLRSWRRLNNRLRCGHVACASRLDLRVGKALDWTQKREHSNHCHSQPNYRRCFRRFHTLWFSDGHATQLLYELRRFHNQRNSTAPNSRVGECPARQWRPKRRFWENPGIANLLVISSAKRIIGCPAFRQRFDAKLAGHESP